MEIKIDIRILKPFLEYPTKSYLVREISRKVNVNHTTVWKYLKYLEKEEILEKKKGGLYPVYRIILSRKFLNLKLYYNLEKLRNSGLLEELERKYDNPTIVLFGSYSKAIDDNLSDIDLCLITEVEKEISMEGYEKFLNRKVSLHIFNKKKWVIAKVKNKELINSILNGIVLEGELVVL